MILAARKLARQHARRLAAIAIVAPLYLFARPPSLSSAESAELAARFHFERHELPDVSARPHQAARPVQKSLAHIAGWINTLGAGVALCDLDRNGLADDIVLCDPRTDEVSVQPAPGTGARYAPFVLDPGEAFCDRSTMAPMGALPCDLNEDGLLDVLVYYWGRTPIAFLRRESSSNALGAGSFVAREIIPGNERWYTNCATAADLDGDGHLDLVIGNYFADGARILDPQALEPDSMQASMSRALNGGRNRLLRWVSARGGEDPDVVFEDVQGVLSDELAKGWTLAVGAVDLDGDLLPEIYFANDFGHDRLLHNRSRRGQFAFALLEGRPTFGTPASKVLGRDSFKGMGVDFGDVNGDGLLDIYVSNITTEFGLQESQFMFVNTGEVDRMQAGIAPFVDDSEGLGLSRSGWAWDAKLADYDDDGVLEAQQALGFLRGTINRWPELHEVAMGNDQMLSNASHWHRFAEGDDLSGHSASPFFVRGSDGRFHDLAPSIGIDAHEVRRGVAIADIDGDGRLDFAVANQWSGSAVYFNRSKDRGAALNLSLLLPINQTPGDATVIREGAPDAAIRARAAVGALLSWSYPDERPGVPRASGDHRAHATFVDGGNGHGGHRSTDVHIGLGHIRADEHIDVRIRWRDVFGGAHSRSFGLHAGRTTIYLGAEVTGT